VDNLQHPSLRTVVGVLLLPKLMSVRTNYSTLITADRHITIHRYSPQTAPEGGEGGKKTNKAAQYIYMPYIFRPSIMLSVFHFRRMHCGY